MKQIEAFSCEDGHIESIIIGAEQAKVSFRTWEGRGLVMIFEGVEKIISSHSVYGDIGAFCIAESNNGLKIYTFEDAWGDAQSGEPQICLSIKAQGLKIYEAESSGETDRALFDVGTDFLGGQKIKEHFS